jgi:hypothetical protein
VCMCDTTIRRCLKHSLNTSVARAAYACCTVHTAAAAAPRAFTNVCASNVAA